ncbi:phosphatase PAP2 family protein [Cohnella sp. LGH]|uniref:phosphatase PAP2 family protein n=1 Tax=unclassified Cohnella TaxID=2636738 RepID=UPI001ADB7581|nr:phosphatase PAP2 family protein [Cohnella sp. LGH]QTH39933.1 phosphatase PAP2 family protein [Cohnella sp. LGH]
MTPNYSDSADTTAERGKKAWKPLLALLAIPAINVLYVLQNRPNDSAQSLVTEVDRMTPLIPAFALPYVLWYPFLLLVFVLILRKDKQEYYRTLLAMCLGLLLSNLVFLFFQTTVPRPDVAADGVFNRLIQFVYANDQPYNCFPSVHVMTSALMIYGSRVLGWGTKIPLAIFGASIIASTLFIKQHVLADVLGGLLAAKLVFWLAGELMPLLLKTAREKLSNERSVSRT